MKHRHKSTFGWLEGLDNKKQIETKMRVKRADSMTIKLAHLHTLTPVKVVIVHPMKQR